MDLFKFSELILIICLFHWKTDDCYSIVCDGVLEVDQGPVVLMGSNLRVLCRAKEEHCGRHFTVYLNQCAQTLVQVINCTAVRLILTNITAPNFELVCKASQHGREWVICGKTLWSGHPPDKPTKLRCLAPRDSAHIECTWKKGKETHIPTNYSVTFENENSTHSFHQWSNNGNPLHVPRSVLGVDGKCSVKVRAQNFLGESVSDVFLLSAKDIEIPGTPKIIQVCFKNGSLSATLLWQSSENSRTLRPRVGLKFRRDGAVFWDEREGFEPRRGVLVLEGLQPVTQYEFHVRLCTTERNLKCSMWSPPAWIMSPARAPSRKLDVWRIFGNVEEMGGQNVTVLWKPLSTEDYTGTVLRYEITYEERGERKTIFCAANVTRCVVQPLRGVKTLSVTAVTSAGNSPAADLNIVHPGPPSPQVTSLVAIGEHRVLLTWRVYGNQTEPVVCHVVQWQSNSMDIHWKRIPAAHNATIIDELKQGIRFNVSLYTLTSSGSSAPASGQVYSKDEIPLSGPKVSIQAVEKSRILIQWEEVELSQRRGFITNYSLYIRKCDTRQRLAKVTLPGPQRGERWLDSPDTSFDLHASACNAAGEGPLGEGISCWIHPQGPPEGDLSAMVSLPVVILLFVVFYLTCWNCVRRRTKEMCVNFGPQWLFEKIPKVENSSVRKLLQEKDRNESISSWTSLYCDPPITPVEEIPAEEQTGCEPPVLREDSSSEGVSRTNLLLEDDSGYKPQTSPFIPEEFLEQEDSIEDMTTGPEGSEFLTQWPWQMNQVRGSPDLSTLGTLIKPVCSVRAGGALREEGREQLSCHCEEVLQGQTLLPNNLASCLFGLTLDPARSITYFPQEVLRMQNH